MRTSGKKKFLIIAASVCLLVMAIVYWQRANILCMYGKWLHVGVEPEKSDVIVVLRGGTNYARVLEAAALYKSGFSKYIYISRSLSDKSDKRLEKLGVSLDSNQEVLQSILLQLDIPEKGIIMGHRRPGGGTLGESRRVRGMMLEKGFEKAIIVTNWWHTRRARAIYRDVLGEKGLATRIVAAGNDVCGPCDWWHYRYIFVNVLKELPKIWIYHLHPASNFSFEDDPEQAQ